MRNAECAEGRNGAEADMSFQMIHMEIAYRLLQYFPQVKHPAEFILGSVAPDAVHMVPDAVRLAADFDVTEKIRSHLFEGCGPWGDTQDYELWERNIGAFFETNVAVEADPVRRDFMFGIFVHCLTDYWNDLKIWRKAQSMYLPSMPLEAFKDAFYREYRSIDWWLYQNSEHTAKICALLADAALFSIEGLVNGEKLANLKKYLLTVQYNMELVDITRNRFFTAERIEDFMAFVVDAFEKQLRNV